MKKNYTEEDYGLNYKNHILEQYKLYVEMADRISQRRATANTFFISVNTFLIAVVTLFDVNNYLIFRLVALVGIVLCFAWYYLLNSYKHLNCGKFKIVLQIEKLLPISPYEEEWNELGHGKNRKLYYPVSSLEISIPVMLSILYMLMFWW